MTGSPKYKRRRRSQHNTNSVTHTSPNTCPHYAGEFRSAHGPPYKLERPASSPASLSGSSIRNCKELSDTCTDNLQASSSPRATTKPNQTTNQPTMMDSKNPASHKEDGAMIPIKDIPSMSLGRPLVRVPLVPRLAAATPLFTKRAFSQNQTRAPQVSRYAALFAEQAKAKAAKEAEMDPRAVKVAARADDIFWIVQAVLQAFRIRATAAQVVRSTYGPMLVRRAPAKVDDFDDFGGPVVGVGYFTGMLYYGVPAEVIREVCEGVCERSASLKVEDDEEVEYEEAEAETEEETEAESEAGVEAEDDYDIMSWSGRKGDSPAY
ncbi:hypothetical protein LTR02_007579 [Friedmanniomyces endolithicus]|nr:hypothetical protein LTR75_002250 [Friedmanniomyces endolithicus]KAK0851690.1 hypothetical protein LTR03_003947 [Friedmanniomyces endolithicus]KAK0869027.1 hypothetical protein LTS02_003227 [Friedmanniomyces endolithicus]KAK0882956.1 hypothetical protein LTR87_003182 [Friedmanniomyces endolithicus]KAK0903493.1 hypothetical protein LTR02_007579 [Friedmanniomyces endolithicus]